MLKAFVADLHIHTLLSPCADVEMTPRHIVLSARRLGIDIIAITDHNAADHVGVALEAAKGTGVTVIPGMEVETREEVHVLCFFPDLAALAAWQRQVDAHLPALLNTPKVFGEQFLVDAEDRFLGVKNQLLLTPLRLSLREVAARVAALGGVCVPSHVDRPAYSILSNLGIIPPDIDLPAVEISRRVKPQEFCEKFPELRTYTLITASDAHYIQDLGSAHTIFYLEKADFHEIRLAFYRQAERKAVVGP